MVVKTKDAAKIKLNYYQTLFEDEGPAINEGKLKDFLKTEYPKIIKYILKG